MKIILIVLICVSLNSCGLISTFKVRDAMEQETVTSNSFKQEIPFRTKHGFIIIDVKINNKVYNFIFDTGASTILNHDIAQAINYENIGVQKHKGTSGKKENLKMVTLDSLSISGVTFSSIVAGIADLDALKKKFCLDFDGIIGANVMNKAVWQIDYSKKVITLTNSRDSLQQSTGSKTFNFNATGKGTPMLSLSINGQYIGEGKLDTGSNGGIDLPESYKTSTDTCNPFIVKNGFSSGFFADRLESSKTTFVSKFKIGSSFELNNTLITYNKTLPYALIGNDFLRDYVVTIDWKYQKIILSSYQPHKKTKFNTFGFYPTIKDGKIIINSIIENSSADKEGLKINDQILQINSINCSNLSHLSYCELLEKRSWNDGDRLTIIVKRGDKELERILTKQDLIKSILNGKP